MLVALLLLAGCAGGGKPEGGPNKDEAPVREAFTALQEAIKAKDADKIWALLDEDSQADAERAARDVRDSYAKADAAERAKQEKALGLSGEKLAALDGKGFLKTSRFHGKYDEIPDSKIEKITIGGDNAAVNYLEPDGDKEKLVLVRQAGKWKFTVPMPRGT
jgi:hypothetical protein